MLEIVTAQEVYTGHGHIGILDFGKAYFKVFKEKEMHIFSIYYKECKEGFEIKK